MVYSTYRCIVNTVYSVYSVYALLWCGGGGPETLYISTDHKTMIISIYIYTHRIYIYIHIILNVQ